MLDRLYTRATMLAVPAVVAVFTLLVAFQQHPSTQPKAPGTLFSVIPDPDERLTLADAIEALGSARQVSHVDTHLAEHPFWVGITLSDDGHLAVAVDFSSRHTQQLECWSESGLYLGKATRHSVTGGFRASRAGFVLDLADAARTASDLVCRMEMAGPARIAVATHSLHSLAVVEDRFYFSAGMLDGGMLALVVFTLVVALTNREPRYLLLSLWLFFNFRLAALSMGWDEQWLWMQVPPEWVHALRKFTIALYYILTLELLRQNFGSTLRQDRFRGLIPVAGAGGLALLVLAAMVPFNQFLPLMWAIVTLGIGIVIFLLTHMLVVGRSRTALWFSLALSIALLAGFSEVLAAAFDLKFLLLVFNNISAALVSSLLVTFAVADQLRFERQERIDAQRSLSLTYDTAPIGLFTAARGGELLRSNRNLRQMVGRHSVGEMNTSVVDLIGPGDWRRLISVADSGSEREVELQLSSATGDSRWFLARASANGNRIEGSLQDITERIEARDKLQFLATHDRLTTLLNRHGFTEAYARKQDEFSGVTPGLLFLDLCKFSLINEMYRSQAGDMILREVASRIRRVVPQTNPCGRIGSDQFLVLVTRHSPSELQVIAQAMVDAVESAPFRFGVQSIWVKVALGLVEVGAEMTTATAISMAERACAEAKSTGTSIVTYTRSSPAHVEHSRELYLKKLLGAEAMPPGLHLLMQPLLSLSRPEQSLNFEVLLRLRDVSGDIIPINQVLDAAVVSGHITRLDLWVVREVIRWVGQHFDDLETTQFVCVNLSGASLNDPGFVDDIIALLERHPRETEKLCFEITEGIALSDLSHTNRFIARFKECGASIALDDFGAGYTSFSYLRNLQADALKLDGSFVQSINSHPANAAIVSAIIELSKNLGMRSVTEGVEDVATLSTLAELGADYIQGFVVVRPQPLDKAITAKSTVDFVSDPSLLAKIREIALLRHEQDAVLGGDEFSYH